ncbi:MAG: CDGSH iron-sulfur domain-containing protein, partial [Acidobacteria bacterium]|nr:CDGSH iron-sulfur domain-containing protein [Acidobacteriota bacterium]
MGWRPDLPLTAHRSPLTAYLSTMPDSRPTPLSITIRPAGTIVIEGEVIVRDTAGNILPQPPAKHPGIVKLCGCGRSATKPFCDGSHKQAIPAPP